MKLYDDYRGHYTIMHIETDIPIHGKLLHNKKYILYNTKTFSLFFDKHLT